MKKFFIKDSMFLVRKSNKDYKYCVVVNYTNGTSKVVSCHLTRESARKKIRSMISDYIRHPDDFNENYVPTFFNTLQIKELVSFEK